MPTLTEVLRDQSPSGSPAEIAAWLAQSVAVESDDAVQTFRTLAERFGAEAVDAAVSALKQTGTRGEWVLSALAGAGVNLGTPRAKTEIGQLRPLLGDTLTDALLSLGVTEAPRWQTLGLPSEPSEADVSAALARAQVATFPLRSVLLSVNVQASGQAAVSCRVTPCAVVDGETVTGQAETIAFSGGNLTGAKATMLAAILAAVDAHREDVSNG